MNYNSRECEKETIAKIQKKVVFKKYDQEQSYLFPSSLDEYIGKFHIARIISHVIDKIDISHIVSSYKGGGTSSYHPRMLLKVWNLGYIYHEYISRQLAKMLREYTAFMWISGKQEPDFWTLNNFRKRLGKDIKSIICPQVTTLVFDQEAEETTETVFKETMRRYKASEEDCSICPEKYKSTNDSRRWLYINKNYIMLNEKSRNNLESERRCMFIQ
jgi:transposase